MASIHHRDPPGITPGDRVRFANLPEITGTVVDKYDPGAGGLSVCTVLVDGAGTCLVLTIQLDPLDEGGPP